MRGSTTAPSAPERWREKGEVVPAFMLWHNPVQPPITIAKALALSWSSWMKSQCLSKQNWFIWGTIVLSHISDHMRSWLWAWPQHVLQIWTGEHVLRGTGVCVLPDAGSWGSTWQFFGRNMERKGCVQFCILDSVGNGSPATGSSQECVYPWLS